MRPPENEVSAWRKGLQKGDDTRCWALQRGWVVQGDLLGARLPAFECQLSPDSLVDLGHVPPLHSSRSASSPKSGIMIVPSPKSCSEA